MGHALKVYCVCEKGGSERHIASANSLGSANHYILKKCIFIAPIGAIATTKVCD